MMIANWLHLNGIDYAYERPFPHDTATVQYRQYKPDFYLPQYDLYLEHFGVDRDGNTAPWIDAAEYRAGMEWKRAAHKRYRTRLIETYSYERKEGRLLEALREKLTRAGVKPRPLPADAVLESVERQRLIEPIAKLLATFLSLFKGNLWTYEQVEAAAHDTARSGGDPTRAVAFLRLFARIHRLYESELAADGEIDFSDMIGQATAQVESRRYVSPFTHIVVDEFQDLSRGRGRLLKSLLAQVPGRRLFCVGDDWQSIYRFTGSDIGQMTGFEAEFGFTRRCDLTLTHRFVQEILEASSQFVQRNPSQLRKKLVSSRRLGKPAIELHACTSEEPADRLLLRILTEIEQEGTAARRGPRAASEVKRHPTVLVLGRYNHTLPENSRRIEQRYPALAIRWMTAHGAKGLEADYVVVLDVTNGRFGFPSEVVDDPVLNLVLAAGGEFPNAEERRLFYVALTRAKTRAFVLTDAARRSKFVEELSSDEYKAWVRPLSDDVGGTAPCPGCGGGTLVERRSEYGLFWGCSNYPLCEVKAKSCPHCERGLLAPGEDAYRCSSPSCGHTLSICPSCGQGALVLRSGAYGEFYGCSEWRPAGAGPSCTFTRPAGDGRRSPHRWRT